MLPDKVHQHLEQGLVFLGVERVQLLNQNLSVERVGAVHADYGEAIHLLRAHVDEFEPGNLVEQLARVVELLCLRNGEKPETHVDCLHQLVQLLNRILVFEDAERFDLHIVSDLLPLLNLALDGIFQNNQLGSSNSAKNGLLELRVRQAVILCVVLQREKEGIIGLCEAHVVGQLGLFEELAV